MYKTQFLSRAALLICFVVASMVGVAQTQVTITASIGTTGPTNYSTLGEAFAKINDGTHKGAIEIRINASTTETAVAVLNASGSGSASYTGINIYPTTTGLSISGALATPLINLNGADNVTIDGRVNATGSTKSLIITNSSALSTSGSYSAARDRGPCQQGWFDKNLGFNERFRTEIPAAIPSSIHLPFRGIVCTFLQIRTRT